MSRLAASCILLLVGALWGFGFIAQTRAMEALGPNTVVAIRFCLASLAILPLALREGRRASVRLGARDWWTFALIGAFLFAGSAAQQIGLLTTTVTNSGFLTGLYVVMVPLFAVALFRQWPHPVIWPAVLVAMLGIWLLSGGQIGSLVVGDGLTVLGAAFFALQLIFIGCFANGTGRPITLSVVQFAVCAAFGLVAAVATEGFDRAAMVSVLPELLYAGIVSSGIAFTLQAVAQAHVSAPTAAILLASESIFAAAFGALFMGDRLSALGFFGCALILAAILTVETVPAWMARRRAAV
ncbi:MAG: DMT family transporter [Methylobacterium mesophilicum]|nr:DMT family transporter [Methylobacterium mesophilicum]